MHIILEIFEYHAGSKIKMNKALNGKLAPLIGGAVGLLPQCGFSVVSTKLYSNNNIKLGTLLAVYIATSDEAIPILIAQPQAAIKLVPLLIIKFVFAIIVGYGVNFFLRKRELAKFEGEDAKLDCGCHGHEIGAEEQEIKEKKGFDFKRFIWHPIIHTLTIILYIFIFNLVLNTILSFVGEDVIVNALSQVVWLQPFVAGLVGLIPNCASSVLITQMYAIGGGAIGGLSLGAAVAGLSVNAGIGLAVLFKENKNLKQNLLIVAFLYLICVAAGLIVTGFEVAFF